MMELFHLINEDKITEQEVHEAKIIEPTPEEYAEYRAAVEAHRRDFEARMEERRKIRDVPCANCGHLCAVHTLVKTCHEKSSTGEFLCNCPDFVPAT